MGTDHTLREFLSVRLNDLVGFLYRVDDLKLPASRISAHLEHASQTKDVWLRSHNHQERRHKVSKLKAATRNKLPSSAFGLPGQRKYPMEDRTHQIKAEEFATKEHRARKLSPAAAARIRVKAKRLLGN